MLRMVPQLRLSSEISHFHCFFRLFRIWCPEWYLAPKSEKSVWKSGVGWPKIFLCSERLSLQKSYGSYKNHPGYHRNSHGRPSRHNVIFAIFHEKSFKSTQNSRPGTCFESKSHWKWTISELRRSCGTIRSILQNKIVLRDDRNSL